MDNREYMMQRIHDKLEMERLQEDAMDRKLLADNARLARRVG